MASFNSSNRSSIISLAVASDPIGPWGGTSPPPVSLIMYVELGHWRDDNNAIWDSKAAWQLNLHDQDHDADTDLAEFAALQANFGASCP